MLSTTSRTVSVNRLVEGFNHGNPRGGANSSGPNASGTGTFTARRSLAPGAGR